MKRCLLCLIAVFLTVVVLAPDRTGTAQTTVPALTVEAPRIDLGEVVAGRDAVATFTFRNSGAEDITIIRAKPS